MGDDRFEPDNVNNTQMAKKPPAPTEQQVIDAVEGWEEGAAYRKARHAANVGGCYSTATICLVHEVLENQRLTDDLVRNRLAQGEFTSIELNPTAPGTPHVKHVLIEDHNWEADGDTAHNWEADGDQFQGSGQWSDQTSLEHRP